ncbi:hypothetical protein yaldo0001_16800 [Yersinia aldovae ATCC 35236]|nr:hypothetical protein yaldo0001_16800 [Yersinia aldovae ATCC 35236]
MVVGEGLFVTSFLTLRAAAARVVSLRSTRTLSKVLTFPSVGTIFDYDDWY